MPTLLSQSLCRSLTQPTSFFSRAVLAVLYRRQRILDCGWFGGMLIWLILSRPADVATASIENVLFALLAFNVVTCTLAQLRTHRRMSSVGSDPTLAYLVVPGEDGRFTFNERQQSPDFAVASLASLCRIHVLVLILNLFVAAGLLYVSRPQPAVAEILTGLSLIAYWLALRVLLTDLVMDTWPGFGSVARLRITAGYYVQMFEQWVVSGVPLVIAFTFLAGPALVLLGISPPLVAGFSVWMLICLVLAQLWNARARKRTGEVILPTPFAANRYAVSRPGWAYFVTTLHVGMAIFLVSGIVVLNN